MAAQKGSSGATPSSVRWRKNTGLARGTPSSFGCGGPSLLGQAEQRIARESEVWNTLSGDDVLNEHVIEMHHLSMQINLLGQGTPEGYVDHEFPPKSESIDGIRAPVSKRGQEKVIELTSRVQPLDDDEDAPMADAPRCFCGRKTRQNRVRLPGCARGRPFFACPGRHCRFLAFGGSCEKGVVWRHFATGRGAAGGHVVVGVEGFQPRDARCSPQAEEGGLSLLVSAVAVLAERPELLARLLPGARPGSEEPGGCQEVRLCIDGRWRALLVDEWLPVVPSNGGQAMGRAALAPAGRNDSESLSFGRSAGNEVWLQLIEKAYSKAFGSYFFALLGATLDEILVDLTGAPVETVQLSPRVGRAEADVLWQRIRNLNDNGLLMACSGRMNATLVSASVHAVLAVVEADDLDLAAAGIGGSRAVRLRNPRAGIKAADYHNMLAVLRGIPAEGSTHADGSFWVQFPDDFIASFCRIDACHAALAGGRVAHTKSFEGEFSQDNGLGIRNCAIQVRTQGDLEAECWLSVVQPMPIGARLLTPLTGRVLNDVGLIVLDSEDLTAQALVFGGASREATCRLVLQPRRSYVVLPLSFRSWAGPVVLRVQSTLPLQTQAATPDSLAHTAWDSVLRLVTDSTSDFALRGGPSSAKRWSYSLCLSDDGDVKSLGLAAELVVVQLEGAVVGVVINPHRDKTLLVRCSLVANHSAVHTSRGASFGEFLESTTQSNELGAHWRRYDVEDVVQSGSSQLIFFLFSLSSDDLLWELNDVRAEAAPLSLAGDRPRHHPFAPHSLISGSSTTPTPSRFNPSPHVPDAAREATVEDRALALALEISMEEASQCETRRALDSADAAPTLARGRWARRERHPAATKDSADLLGPRSTCEVCVGSIVEPAPLSCCSQRICRECLERWVSSQVLEHAVADVQCPICHRQLSAPDLSRILKKDTLRRLEVLKRERLDLQNLQPPSERDLGLDDGVLKALGLRRCPSCGTGMQKESETCHKMICRTCRAKFCFKCLSRLEHFNCRCTGAEHNFVDPVNGRIIAHQ